MNSLQAGGAERIAAYLANTFQDQGAEVVLLTLSGQERDYFRLDAKVQRESLGLDGTSRSTWDALGNNLRRVLALRRALQRLQPQAALAVMSTSIIHLALATGGLPILTLGAEHSQPSHSPIGKIWQGLRMLAYGWLDILIALTPETAAWMQRHTRARRIVVIPNPVICPLPEQAPYLSPSSCGISGHRRLLAVGRLARVKGYDRLLLGFSRLADRHPDWELIILGEGPERPDLEAQIRRLGLTKRIFLPGQAGNLTDWYESADLFVMSSRHEGFPNVLLEAMSHGLPAISFDCEAGPRNIIRHEIDGLLVPADDIEALSAGLDRLMTDPECRLRFAAQALDVRNRFSEHHITGLWRQLFQSGLRDG